MDDLFTDYKTCLKKNNLIASGTQFTPPPTPLLDHAASTLDVHH